jgi:3-methylfumaryl-CoA hydratase
LYFLPHAKQSEIGPDGHAKRGGFLPPVPLPRRMWAGGRLHWEHDLVIGDAIERVSTIKSVTHKSGRSGDLLFVLVEHQIHNAKGLALTEEHDIVYRAAASPDEKAPDPTPAPSNAKWSKIIQPDPVLLFRYSALTFNGHRIHYDRSYVTQEEGYPGLIVHGPLIATLLVDLVRQSNLGKKLKRFEFRAVRPTFDIHSMQVNASPDLATDSSGKTLSVWAQDHEGWLTMQAKAELV